MNTGIRSLAGEAEVPAYVETDSHRTAARKLHEAVGFSPMRKVLVCR